MLLTPLNPKYETYINIRPIKIAYFFREDDEESLLRILRFINTQWGGMHNLIIPVQSSGKIIRFFQELLEMYEPEWFVSYLIPHSNDNQEQNDSLRQYLQELFPTQVCKVQVGTHFETHDQSLHSVGVIPEETLKQNSVMTQPKFPLASMFPEWVSLALYGAIYPDQEEFYKEHFQFYGADVHVDSIEFWDEQSNMRPFSSLLKLTSYGFNTYTTTGVSSNHFEVVLVNSLNTLCLFWNLRSLHLSSLFPNEFDNRTLMIPEALLNNESALNSMFSFIKRRIKYHEHRANIDIVFPIWNESDRAKISQALESFSFVKEDESGKFSVKMSSSGFREDRSTIPDELVYTFFPFVDIDKFQEGVHPRVPISTSLSEGQNTILYRPPSTYANSHGGSVVIDIQCDIWQRFPKGHLVAKSILNGSRFSRYGISAITTVYSRHTNISFTVPDEWNALRMWFTEKEYVINSTKVSQYSDAVVQLLGGLSEVSLLASKNTNIILDSLSVKNTKKIAQHIIKELLAKETQLQKIEHLFDEFEVIPELTGVTKTFNDLKSRIGIRPEVLLELLEKLCAKQILKRGFYLPCPNCGNRDWYPLHTLREHLTCIGCAHTFLFPVRASPSTELPWQYRLNTLVNRAIDQDVLPGILALYYLAKDKQTTCNGFGIQIQQEGKTITDFDFVFVSNQSVFAGECKSGTELAEKDLETARLAASLGISTFYFCTTRTFSDETKQHIDSLQKELESKDIEMKIEILMSKELLGEEVA